MKRSPTNRSLALVVATASLLSACGGAPGRRFAKEREDNPTLTDTTSISWRSVDSISAPSPRAQQIALANDRLVAIWGGYSQDADGNTVTLSDGGLFYLDSRSWSRFPSPASVGGALADLVWSSQASATLTSSALLVWNGYLAGGNRIGAALDLATNSWSAISTTNSPPARQRQQALLAGDNWVIFGGGAACERVDGAMLNTTTLTWTTMATPPADVAAGCDNAIALGTSIFVWGGAARRGDRATGAIFDTLTNSWRALPTAGAPSARRNFSLQVSGDIVFIIGGVSGEGTSQQNLSDAYYFSVENNSWTPLTSTWSWQSQKLLSATNSAGDLFLFGYPFVGSRNETGYLFSRSESSWSRLPEQGAPSKRVFDTAPIAIPDGFVVLGGCDNNGHCQSGGSRFSTATRKWSSLSTTGAPSARRFAAQLWTTQGLFVWGGCACGLGSGSIAPSSSDRSEPRPSCYRNDGALLNL
jgi:hypothetical protein